MSDNKFIKIIGVGNGGCNIVNNMFKEGNLDVSYTVCNTDKKALKDSPVPDKLFLERGLDKMNDWVTGIHRVAEYHIEQFRQLFNDGTRMAFISAGMGGTTGTYVAPIIARISKEMGILTIGVVTTPFFFEGEKKISLAFDGVIEMSKYVDTLLVINNEQIRKIEPDSFILDTISKADETLNIAAHSISDIITNHGLINLDFNDIKSVFKDSGVAIVTAGYGEGNHRVNDAIESALNSRQLKYVDIFKAKKIILNISYSNKSKHVFSMEEMNSVNDFMSKFKDDFEIKWGVSISSDLNDGVKITILATGFEIEDVADRKIYENDINHNIQPATSPLNDNQVFISYKRTDRDQVFYLKDLIEDRIGNHCWIDLDGIESDAQFANVIIKAINEAKVFLFMYSSAHSQIEDFDNDWTVREINFAQKKRKRIVFVNIDGTPLTDWFELMFGTKQQVDANSDVAMQKLCKDMTKWLNVK